MSKVVEEFSVQLVVVDQCRKAISQTVPNVPDEGTLVEQVYVLSKETITQPGFQALASVTGIIQLAAEHIGTPLTAVSIRQQVQQSIGRPGFTSHGRNTDDAVFVGQFFQTIRADRRAIGKLEPVCRGHW